MIVFRHADPRFPFLWESAEQPPGRWHAEGDGPAHYFADTPHGAWAELLRHEEIRDPEDLGGIQRALWAVEIPGLPGARPLLDVDALRGGPDSYRDCQAEAARLRQKNVAGLTAPSAGLISGQADGWIVDGGLQRGPARNGEVYVYFGVRTDLLGWPVVLDGRPPDEVLERVRHF